MFKAYLVEPESRKITEVWFDGSETAIAQLIGSRHVSYEQFTGLEYDSTRYIMHRHVNRVYFAVDADQNSDIPGFVIQHTGGRVNHGRCLIVGYDTDSRQFAHARDIRPAISHYYVPGKGAY